MTLLESIQTHRSDVLRAAAKHGARNVRIFGSVVRGESGARSDIDFLVEMESGRSLLDLVGFNQELESLFGKSVDVLSERGLSPYLKDRILNEAVPL